MKPLSLFQKLVLFFATGAGVGLIPGAKGTYGTFLAFVLLLLSRAHFSGYYPIFVFFWTIFSILIADRAEKILRQKDAQLIVIDELSGFFVSLLFLPLELRFLIFAFCLFRCFDILKPPPIRVLESRLPGGFGVVLDDVVAGVYANLILQVFWHLGGDCI